MRRNLAERDIAASIPWRKSIAGKMVLIFCSLFAVVLLTVQSVELYGLPYGLFRGSVQEMIDQEFVALGTVADTKKILIESWLKERRSDARIVAVNPVVRALINTPSPSAAMVETVSTWLASLLDTYHYESISIVDAVTGLPIAFAVDHPPGGPVTPYPYLQVAARPGVDESIIIVGTQDRIHVVRQLGYEQSDHGEPRALLVIELNTDTVFKPLLATPMATLLGKSWEVILADSASGRLIQRMAADPDSPVPATIRDNALQLAQGGSEGTIIDTDYRNVPVLAAYRHIPLSADSSWGLVIKKDKAEVLAPAHRNRQVFLWFSLFGIVIVCLISLIISRALTGPLRMIMSTSAEIESGNLSARVPVVGSDELAALGRTFNAMVNQLQAWHEELDARVLVQTEEIRAINEDLERRVAARTEELQAALKDIESFSYSISHDLRAPLRAIDGYCGILNEEFRGRFPEEAGKYLVRMSHNARRMGQLIDDLLVFSRLSRQQLECETVDMGLLFREVFESLMSDGEPRNVTFEVAPLPPCQADPKLLRQVVINLLSNALKFSGGRSPANIAVTSRSVDGETVYSVTDNGVGFDHAYSDKLFGVFQRYHKSEEFEGTGVGLAIVHNIIQRHGGRVWAESEPGKGATFFFTVGSQTL